MANELEIQGSIFFAKGNTARTGLKTAVIKVDVSGDGHIIASQNVGTSEEALILGDVSTSALGLCMIVNKDATNFVEIRPGTTVADLIKIKAGEFALFRFADLVTAPFAIADTAAVEVDIYLFED